MLHKNTGSRLAHRWGFVPGVMALTLAITALCTQMVRAQENPDVTLQGVSRSFIEANGLNTGSHAMTIGGLPVAFSSLRGFDSNSPPGPQLPRSGFDIVNDGTTGTVLLRGIRSVGGSCAGLNDDAFFLIHVAGRPGDADGDGRFSAAGGACGTRRGNSPANPFPFDGQSLSDLSLLANTELVQLKIYRNCSQVNDPSAVPDLQFSLTNAPANKATVLQLDFDGLTSGTDHGFVADPDHPGASVVGSEGSAWEAGVISNTAFAQPCPATVDGYYLLRIPNWSSYFTAKGLNPGDFSYILTTGSTDDGVGEDLIASSVQLTQPKLGLTKTPDLSLCPGEQGTYTIHVSNDGNAKIFDIEISDQLPPGATIMTSSLPASGTTGTVTFTKFDLAQCESKDVTVTVQAAADCQGNAVNTANVSGVFATFCGGTPGTEEDDPVSAGPATAAFNCKAKPDISIKADSQADRCEGDAITLTGTVTNNSSDPAGVDVTLTITPAPPGGQPAPFHIGPSGSHQFSVDAGGCTGNPSFVIAAAGKAACPPDAQAQVTVPVTCHPKPCVDNVTCSLNLLAACPGTPLQLTASARNCSATEAEDITLTYGNLTHTCTSVAHGEACTFTFDAVMPGCTSGQNVPFHVDASAVNTSSATCGTATGGHDCTVLCKAPQVQIVKTAEGEVTFGDTIHYSIVVTNPSKDTDLENVVVVDNVCTGISNPTNFGCTGTSCPGVPSVSLPTITWPSFNLPAGQSVTLTFDALAVGDAPPGGQCTNDFTCTNHASVTAHCAGADAADQTSFDTIIHCPPTGTCRLTGGGCLNENGGNKGHKQSTFGGNASPAHTGGGPTGNSWEHVYRDGRTILFNWHSPDANVISCTDVTPGPCHPKGTVTRADFVGTGLYSIGAGGRDQPGNMVAYIIDHTEGACNKGVGDYYSIIVRTGLVIGSGDIVFQTAGTIDCGNLQIHQTPARLFGAGITTTGEVAPIGVDNSMALLNKVVPNPFVSSMSFAYEVPEGGSAVTIGVYNVAGRLVRTLASGVQGAGRQSVAWDGKDNAGVRMTNGVYFLRSVVGSTQATYRVIYMAR